MESANQILSEFIAAGQVWYIGQPDKRPALLTDVGLSDAGQDGICLFPSRQDALDFLKATNAAPGHFKPRRGTPHPRWPGGVGAFVRACRRYSPYLCLPWLAADGERFDFYFLKIKQLLAAARQAGTPDRPTKPGFDFHRLRFSDN